MPRRLVATVAARPTPLAEPGVCVGRRAWSFGGGRLGKARPATSVSALLCKNYYVHAVPVQVYLMIVMYCICAAWGLYTTTLAASLLLLMYLYVYIYSYIRLLMIL